MPEGHTTHALAGRLNDAFAGSPVGVVSPQGRRASTVRTQVVAGGNLFWCGRCQRRR